MKFFSKIYEIPRGCVARPLCTSSLPLNLTVQKFDKTTHSLVQNGKVLCHARWGLAPAWLGLLAHVRSNSNFENVRTCEDKRYDILGARAPVVFEA